MQVNKTYNVAVIDDSLVSHTGLCCLINNLYDFTVIDCSGSSRSIEQERWHGLDVLLFSIKSLDINFVHQLNRIMLAYEELPILVLAPGLIRIDQFKLINIGIKAIIVDEATEKSLNEGMICVINHGVYLPKSIIDSIRENTKWLQDRHLVHTAFTELQKKILHLLASGLTSSKVADKLYRSIRTIEWHKEKMMKMVKVKSTAQLLLFALEYGLIESPFNLPTYYKVEAESSNREQLNIS